MRNIFVSVVVLVVVVVLNITIWSVLNRPQSSKGWEGVMKGITFTPLREHHDPKKGILPTQEELEEDLRLLAGQTQAIRTYTVEEGHERLPELAAKYGLNVTVGAWIGSDKVRNQREIDKLIQTGQKYRNVVRTIVGNEALLREEVTVEELIGYLRQVRGKSLRPVSTSEPWHVWLKYPELVNEVDFIAVHILPYWEGLSVEASIDYVFERYDELKRTYPGKPIVITEVGWPSNGKPIRDAVASLANQAKFFREFLNIAHERKLTYYVIEAFDQPWKMALEGSTGGYWGLYDAYRKPKFSMKGDIVPMPTWKQWAMVAAIIGGLVVKLGSRMVDASLRTKLNGIRLAMKEAG